MVWLSLLAPAAAALSALAGTTAAVVAAVALRRNREDQARRDAAGLHAAAYMSAQNYPIGHEPGPDVEPSDRTDVWLIAKVNNASPHPYYAVVTSAFLPSRQKRFAAVADVVPPNSSRYARLGLVDGCDAAGLASDTLVTTTFIDSQDRGWLRNSEGRLDRRKITRRWRKAELLARPHRGAALHRIREMPEPSPEGYELSVTRDAAGHEVEISTFETPTSETAADDEAFPRPVWEPARSLEEPDRADEPRR